MRERFLTIKNNQVKYHIKNDALAAISNSMQKQLNTSMKTNPLPKGAIGRIVFEENKFKAESNDAGLLVFLSKWATDMGIYYSSIYLGSKYVNVVEDPTRVPKVLH